MSKSRMYELNKEEFQKLLNNSNSYTEVYNILVYHIQIIGKH